MLLSMALVFTACNDDRDSNPTLTQPTTFTLNNPVNAMVDLAESEGIALLGHSPTTAAGPLQWSISSRFLPPTVGPYRPMRLPPTRRVPPSPTMLSCLRFTPPALA